LTLAKTFININGTLILTNLKKGGETHMATANDNLAKIVNPSIRKIKSTRLKIQKLQAIEKDEKAKLESILHEHDTNEVIATSGKVMIVEGSTSKRVSGKNAIALVEKLCKQTKTDEVAVFTISTTKGYIKVS
jgi:UDP-glucose 4-epimerase